MFFPIFPWIFQIAVTAFAVIIGLYLASIGNPVNQVLRMTEDGHCICTGNASHYKVNAVVRFEKLLKQKWIRKVLKLVGNISVFMA